MNTTDRTEHRAPSAPTSQRAIAGALRIALLCLVVATTGACSFVEELQPGDTGYYDPNGRGGSPTVGGGGSSGPPPTSGGGGGGTTVPAVVPYTALWMPSPSTGVTGYELDVDVSGGGNYLTIDIPVSSATSVSGGRLAYAIDLETNRDYVLRLRAYSTSDTSPPSNTIVVYGTQLIATAGTTRGAMAGMGSPSAAMASPVSTSSSVASGPVASASTGTASDDVAADASPADGAAELGEADWLSVEFDGRGAHLAGAIDDRVDGSPLTFSTWLRPALGTTGTRALFGSVDAAGTSRFDARIVDGTGLSVTLRDATGDVAVEAVFADALEHDAWQHLALIVDPAASTTPVRLVVSGVELVPVSLEKAAGAPTLELLTGALRVGGADGEAGYAGRMGHTAIFSRALGLDELDHLDARGHAADLRSDLAGDPTGEALLHYWRLGEGVSAESDLGASAWPADLVATGAGVFAVDDAPLPVE